jgi:prolyl oligopeptidase
VIDIIGGPSRLRVFDDQGHSLAAPSLPPVSAIDNAVYIGGGDALFYSSTYLDPPAWYSVDAANGKPVRTAISGTSAVKFDDAEVVREFAVSKDGTRVPLTIIRRKGTKLDGTHPVLLNGYGGFGISLKPSFAGSQTRVWLDQGGISATANLRGVANTVRNGTRRVNSFTSRMFLTTSSLVRNTWWNRNTLRLLTLPLSVGATVDC